MSEEVTQDEETGDLFYKGYRCHLSVMVKGLEPNDPIGPMVRGEIIGIMDSIHFYTNDLRGIEKEFVEAVTHYEIDLKAVGRKA